MSENVTPVILTAKELSIRFGDQVILDKASLSVHEGNRIGLVGRNGSGKSTFLKIISGMIIPDSGEVAKKKNLVIGFLSQEFTLDQSKNVYDNILAGAKNELELIAEYDQTPFDSPKKHHLEETILRKDSWNLEKRINILINSLNAPGGIRYINVLSGGEKRRVALCRALISKPELHLDWSSAPTLTTEDARLKLRLISCRDRCCIKIGASALRYSRVTNMTMNIQLDGHYYSATQMP